MIGVTGYEFARRVDELSAHMNYSTYTERRSASENCKIDDTNSLYKVSDKETCEKCCCNALQEKQ